MKAYHKKLTGLFLAAVFCVFPVTAFAAETPVEISSGLHFEERTTECTFDDSRILYGEAEPGTRITVTVSAKNRRGSLYQVASDSFVTGSMGIFTTTFPLRMGYNYITLTAEKKGMEERTETTVVKRLSQRVKTQLQTMIALPGIGRS